MQFFAGWCSLEDSTTGLADRTVVMVGMMRPGVRSSWNRVRNFKAQAQASEAGSKRWQDQGGQLQAQLQHNQLIIMQLWAKFSHTVSLKFSFFPHFLLQESL